MPADHHHFSPRPDSGLVLLSQRGDVVVDKQGRPALVTWEMDPQRVVRIGQATWAARLTPAEEELVRADDSLHLAPARELLEDRRVARAIALVSNRENLRFDPADGSELGFDEDGIVARRAAGGQIFPRIDPAVIGMVTLSGTDRILLGRQHRREFFSLVAGYVDPGENLEEAFAREVMEETGRRIGHAHYWGSQPWPLGGSIMVGFTAQTEDEDAVAETDGELAEIRWATPKDVRDLPLAGVGSIARSMLDAWMRMKTGEGL